MTHKWNSSFLRLLKERHLVDAAGAPDLSRAQEVLELANQIIEEKEGQIQDDDTELEMAHVVLDNNPCTISWVHDDLTYGGVNKTLADVCGLSPEDFPGKTIGFYTNNMHFYNFTERLFKSSEDKIYKEIETDLDGELKKFWVVGSKFEHKKSAVIIGIDITELRNLEENVNFMEKLSSLGEMVAGIVHEINNPLTMIKAQSTKIGMLVNKSEVEKIPESLEKIQNTTDKIGQIIRGVKSFVRHGERDPKNEVLINEIISDAFVICEGRLKPEGIKYEIDLPDLKIEANSTQIFQVFVNLITNSIDAMSDLNEKWIKVIQKEDSNGVMISFSDAGDGIPQEVQKKMFESFFTTKGLGKGTGLGLSLCKKIMLDHGGDLTVDDQASNTTFDLSFPNGKND